jgi:hypothetical protein
MESLAMKTSCDVLCEPATTLGAAVDRTLSVADRAPAEPVSAAGPDSAGASVLGIAQIVELILKDPRRLDQLAHASEQKIELASRLLAISVASFALYGLALSLMFHAAHLWPQLGATANWLNGSEKSLVEFVDTGALPSHVAVRSLRVIIAYSFGLIAASGICLPSLYFHGLLSGLRMSTSDVVVHSLKCTAVAAVALIGILPVYSAVILGAIVFPVTHEFVEGNLILGMSLPFIGGLWGTRALFTGFANLCHTMPAEFQSQRACFLRRLILSWCGCYLAIAPLMIVTVWRHLGS